MNDDQVEQEIQAKGLTAPRIVPGMILALMERVTYATVVPAGTTSTFVLAFLDGKFHLATGFSACVSVENFDAELGEKIAKVKAITLAQDKLWELEGYRMFRSEVTV
jgi:hypothetical protein